MKPWTRVLIPGTHGWAVHGHVPRGDALEVARMHFREQAREAADALTALEHGNARVFHQYGIVKARNRVELEPAGDTPDDA